MMIGYCASLPLSPSKVRVVVPPRHMNGTPHRIHPRQHKVPTPAPNPPHTWCKWDVCRTEPSCTWCSHWVGRMGLAHGADGHIRSPRRKRPTARLCVLQPGRRSAYAITLDSEAVPATTGPPVGLRSTRLSPCRASGTAHTLLHAAKRGREATPPVVRPPKWTRGPESHSTGRTPGCRAAETRSSRRNDHLRRRARRKCAR